MAWVADIAKDAVKSVVGAALLSGLAMVWQHYYGSTAESAYKKLVSPVELSQWQLWLWGAATVFLVIFGVSSTLRRRTADGAAAVSSNAALDPKIEICTEDKPPYQITDVKAGRVESTVKVGIKNAGGKTLSNCKVYIDRIAPPTNSPGGDTHLLEGGGFHLRHDDPEKLLDIASHWDHLDKFKFSTPISGGFFDSSVYMEDGTKRTFAVRVVATECERSALFEIETDAAKRLHLKFLNYIN
ncbi:hypothetical protein WS57_29430 [Burkholderia pseudomultivorans]|nr:hypothetical protein WS57_29430 [Burkholderia pseudomultivorans]